jgi:hypothetical protein
MRPARVRRDASHAGDGEDDGHAALGREHAKGPCIKTKKVHRPAILTSLDQPNRGGRQAE